MEHNKTWKLYWKGVVLQSNIDAKLILKRARFKLTTKVLRDSSCNNLLPIIPEFLFEDTEIDSLNLQTLTPQDWAIRFIDILLNRTYDFVVTISRHNLVTCLNILCNLHKYELSNYQALIVELLETLPNVEVKEVEVHTDRDEDEKTEQFVMFQGNEIKLKELMHQIQITTQLDKKIRDELAIGKVPIVVKNQVPDKLKYYVPRTVMRTHRLNVDILKHDCKDVFVIEGIDRHQLSSLIKDTETTDVSGNQLRKLTVRFILLQYYDDFDKIRKLANAGSVSVHWIKYHDGQLELVKFSGSAKTLHTYIDNPHDSFLEGELATSTQKVVIITDSPGMGKTSLLANIAHQIMRDGNEHITLIRFIVLQEFVIALSKTRINVESIIKTIAEQSSDYEFGRKFVEHVLKSKPCVLLFDGLDEVLSDQISNAKRILRHAATLPHIRIFVATRRHLQDELESTLGVLSHTIRPFALSNQISFLCKVWEMKGAVPNESLTRFTEECIKQLTQKMTDSERSITGIPLQCRMLAETYEDDAIRCSKVGYDLYNNSNSISIITSVFEMYERHINLRFHLSTKANQYNHEVIKNVHMYHALKLLFPDHAIKFKSLNKNSIPVHQLCGLGIIETTHSNDIRFVHRTFAEFLVAWFVYENMETSSMHQTFVLTTIFQTKKIRDWFKVFESIYDITSFSFTFSFPVICYFVNGFPRKEDLINLSSIHYLKEELPIYAASAYHNYSNLPYIVRTCIRFRFIKHTIQRAKNSDIRDLLFVAVRYSSVELMKFICSNIDTASIPFRKYPHTSNLGELQISPLHIAVMRGDHRRIHINC